MSDDEREARNHEAWPAFMSYCTGADIVNPDEDASWLDLEAWWNIWIDAWWNGIEARRHEA